MSPLITRLGALALALAMPLAGCSSQGSSGAGSGYLPQASRASRPRGGPGPLLYVADFGGSSSNSATVVTFTMKGRLRHIISDGVNSPIALGFDPSQEVYVLNASGGSSSSSGDSGPSVSVYQRNSTSLLRQITRGLTNPDAMVLDGHGNVFVANAAASSSSSSSGGDVEVYKSGTTRRIREITEGIAGPRALGTDGSGNLYVLNDGAGGSSSSSSNSGASVTVYGGKAYHELPLQITAGLSAPSAMAVDANGDVFVANAGGGSSSSSGNVEEYAAGSSTPTATITDGVNAPRALALDGAGNLYVLNSGPGSSSGSSSSSSGSAGGSVSVYAPGSTTPSHVISDCIAAPDAIAVAANGALFVANTASSASSSSSSTCPSPSVTEYGSSGNLLRVITSHIGKAVALGVN
jgi:sugar lactone lactonase YvrE